MRIFYLILGGLMAVSLVALAGVTGDSVVEDSSGGGASIGDGVTTATGSTLQGAYPVQFGPGTPGVVASKAGIADAAAKPGVTHLAENASHLATTAGSKTGANTCVCAGVGQRLVTISDYTNVTSVTVNGNHDCATITPSVYTCAGMGTCITSNAVTAKAFVTAINAALPTGIEAAACTTAGGANCADGLFVLKPLPDTCAVTIAVAGTGLAATQSVGGATYIGDDSLGGAVYLGRSVGGSMAGGVVIQNGNYLYTASGYLHVSNGLWSDGPVYSTNGVVGANGMGNSAIRVNPTGLSKGQVAEIVSAVANCTFTGGGGAATCTTAAFIPLGASVLSVTGRQVTPGTTCTTCTAGANMGPGLDADQYGAALECDVDNTLYTAATATANEMGTCLLAGGCTITMTAVGGNCVSGVAAWTVHYISATAATAD